MCLAPQLVDPLLEMISSSDLKSESAKPLAHIQEKAYGMWAPCGTWKLTLIEGYFGLSFFSPINLKSFFIFFDN